MTRILYKVGNALEGPERYLLHGVNNQKVMGAGIALAIKKKYPLAYNRYMEGALQLGDAQFVKCNTKIIINGVTQTLGKPGRNLDYAALRDVIREVNDELYIFDQFAEVAMPRIGAGLGGGRWSRIAEIIESESNDFTPVVYTFESENDGRFN